jgi:hypothetical protein
MNPVSTPKNIICNALIILHCTILLHYVNLALGMLFRLSGALSSFSSSCSFYYMCVYIYTHTYSRIYTNITYFCLIGPLPMGKLGLHYRSL